MTQKKKRFSLTLSACRLPHRREWRPYTHTHDCVPDGRASERQRMENETCGEYFRRWQALHTKYGRAQLYSCVFTCIDCRQRERARHRLWNAHLVENGMDASASPEKSHTKPSSGSTGRAFFSFTYQKCANSFGSVSSAAAAAAATRGTDGDL